MSFYVISIVLFLIGLYAVVIKKDLYRILFGIILMEFSADLFLGMLGERGGATALIGLSMVVIFIALVYRIRETFGTFDIAKIRELKG